MTHCFRCYLHPTVEIEARITRGNDINTTTFNHYSPTFTNKHWTDKKARIIELRREGPDRVVRRFTGPKKWARESSLYPQTMEDALAAFETKVAPIYEKLLTNETLNPLERLVWTRWILCQFSRTPTFILEMAGMEEDVLSALDFPFNTPWSEVESKLSAAVQNVASFHASKELIPLVMLRDWLVLRPSSGEFFIKGDVPVIIRGALVDDDALIIYPLSPTHCFKATVLGGSFPPHQIQGEYQLPPQGTDPYLRLIAAAAERAVICQPQHCSENLTALVGKVIGKSTRHSTISPIPNW